VKIGIHIHVESPEKAILRGQVLELRTQGLSYPAISRALNISEGTAWNYVNKKF
jgi:DNA-binding CsgD family transcriptional regulator